MLLATQYDRLLRDGPGLQRFAGSRFATLYRTLQVVCLRCCACLAAGRDCHVLCLLCPLGRLARCSALRTLLCTIPLAPGGLTRARQVLWFAVRCGAATLDDDARWDRAAPRLAPPAAAARTDFESSCNCCRSAAALDAAAATTTTACVGAFLSVWGLGEGRDGSSSMGSAAMGGPKPTCELR